jgi:anti-sigma regulatory factor (Ser/Thr protein kinase)
MEASRVLTVSGTTEGIRLAAEGFDAFAEVHGLSRHVTWPFQVALDEVVSNVVHHGAPRGGGESRIVIELHLHGDELALVAADDGVPFDPLQAPEPDTSQPVEDRPVGGLGILIVKRLMDQIAYERAGGCNRLTMRRRLVVPEGVD